MHVGIIVVQVLFELIGLIGFLSGYFLDIWWLMIVGGVLVLLDDFVEIAMRILNPIFPVLLAIVLAFIFTPWYVGIFWASSAFKVLGIPSSLKKIFAPKKVLAKNIGNLLL